MLGAREILSAGGEAQRPRVRQTHHLQPWDHGGGLEARQGPPARGQQGPHTKVSKVVLCRLMLDLFIPVAHYVRPLTPIKAPDLGLFLPRFCRNLAQESGSWTCCSLSPSSPLYCCMHAGMRCTWWGRGAKWLHCRSRWGPWTRLPALATLTGAGH